MKQTRKVNDMTKKQIEKEKVLKLLTDRKCIVCNKYGLEKTSEQEVHCTLCGSTYNVKLLDRLTKK